MAGDAGTFSFPSAPDFASIDGCRCTPALSCGPAVGYPPVVAKLPCGLRQPYTVMRVL